MIFRCLENDRFWESGVIGVTGCAGEAGDDAGWDGQMSIHRVANAPAKSDKTANGLGGRTA